MALHTCYQCDLPDVPDFKLHLVSFDGVVLQSFAGKHNQHFTLLNSPYVVTGGEDDNSIQVLDMTTGQILYKFFHPSSTGFSKFSFQHKHNKMFAVSYNGKLYVLKDTEY